MTEPDIPPFIAVFETVAYDHRKLITVVGIDPDAVWSAALDRKNAGGIEHAPEMSGLHQSEHDTGLWMVQLVERAPKAARSSGPCTSEARAGGLQ